MGGWWCGLLHKLFEKCAPAVSVLISVTQKPNDNFSLAFFLIFMQKNCFYFLIKILYCRSSWCNQPLPTTQAQLIIPSLNVSCRNQATKILGPSLPKKPHVRVNIYNFDRRRSKHDFKIKHFEIYCLRNNCTKMSNLLVLYPT